MNYCRQLETISWRYMAWYLLCSRLDETYSRRMILRQQFSNTSQIISLSGQRHRRTTDHPTRKSIRIKQPRQNPAWGRHPLPSARGDRGRPRARPGRSGSPPHRRRALEREDSVDRDQRQSHAERDPDVHGDHHGIRRRRAGTGSWNVAVVGRKARDYYRRRNGKILTEQDLPPEVPAGLPSELLERRPDIRAAEA